MHTQVGLHLCVRSSPCLCFESVLMMIPHLRSLPPYIAYIHHSGSQPFGLVSVAIRNQRRRAQLGGYPVLFGSYDLTSVAPPEDVPCLGIEAG